jgi:DNA (cytosine-5)-methyltransferase 1
MILDLCSGYGGLSMGLQLALPDAGPVVAFADPGAGPRRVLAYRHPDTPNLGDLTAVDWTPWRGVDWITAGYPCQPFSHAGHRKGTADERHLWPDVARAIRDVRPGRVLLENVRGHLSLGFDAVLGDLAGLGYDARWGVVRAADAGAAHNRARLFVVATDADSERRERRGGTWDRGRRPADRDATTADVAAWGVYATAIHRWERTLGRPAPAGTEPGRTGPRLSPRFVEWLQGLPEGWVTDVPGVSRSEALKLLGNGVVPAQAALAVRLLTTALEVAA